MTNLFELIKKVNFKILRLIQLHQHLLRKSIFSNRKKQEKKQEKIIKNFISVFTFFINFLSYFINLKNFF